MSIATTTFTSSSSSNTAGAERRAAEPSRFPAAPRGAEDLCEVISAYQKCVAETVQRFGGFVAKYNWRRSARSSGDMLGAAEVVVASADGAFAFVSLRSAAIASRSLRRCPTAVTGVLIYFGYPKPMRTMLRQAVVGDAKLLQGLVRQARKNRYRLSCSRGMRRHTFRGPGSAAKPPISMWRPNCDAAAQRCERLLGS